MRYLSGLFFALLIGCAPDVPDEQHPPKALQVLLKRVRQTYAPDSRVALLQLSTERKNGQWVILGETNLPEARAAIAEGVEELGARSELHLLPDSSLQGRNYGIVRLSACNIRSEPRHYGELSTQAMLGTPLKLYKKQSGWYLVQTPDGYIGWLDEAGFTAMSKSEYGAWSKSPKVIFLPDFGLAYQQPDIRSRVLTDLLAGNLLARKQKQGDFTQIGLPDGRTGYVSTDQLLSYSEWLDSRQPNATKILKSAQRFLGRPYLWGGTSGKGVDCSGFTKTVFFLNGMMLPRDASQQVAVGEAVVADSTLSGLKPGDLLFFGRAAKNGKKEKVTHVALYMGDGKIIHATGSVKIESLRRGEPDFAEERLKTFIRAKRMLTPQLVDSLSVGRYEGYSTK